LAGTAMLQTEYAFSLPCGFVDAQGNLHRDGIMRLATARDEIEPLADARVQENQAYLAVLLLSRVVLRLGSISPVTPVVIEGMFSADFAYLQDLYVRVNDLGTSLIETRCPECGAQFALDLAGDGDGRIDER
jgi:hypothetical protein